MLEKYFKITSDGKYEFLGGIDKKKVLDSTIKALDEEIKAQKKMADQIKLLNKNDNSGYDATMFTKYRKGEIIYKVLFGVFL